MRQAFTLLEIIVTLVITGILAVGTFKAIDLLYLHASKAKAVTELSLESQVVLDEISALLYNRIPSSVIGYMRADNSDNTCVALDDANESYMILEWLHSDEAQLTAGAYDGFVELSQSTNTHLKSLDLNASSMGNGAGLNLVFAGSNDAGDPLIAACNGAFGWHGNDSNSSYDISIGTDDAITISDSINPQYIYEKFYLSDGAYAVARGVDIDANAACIDNNLSTLSAEDMSKSLLLFYGYHPWSGESFCADLYSNGTPAGSVTVLSLDVAAFGATISNASISLKLDLNRSIRGGSQSGAVVHITKQKAVF